MSSKVDDRIVNMKFNNSQFEKGVADTSKSLSGLKGALSFKGAGEGLKGLASGIKNFSLEGMANGIQSIASKFSALSVVGITALANIANKAVDAGLRIAKSLTIDPIKAGFDEYELKMGSIQTILANTARYGTQLPEVTANLDALNEYADKTIYNFGDMTKNIGLFTNAGIKVGDATSMIKGFSNEAAASGTSSQGAASAAYQLSQALSAGTIRLMDWRSLQNVGMGNKNMQNGLIEIANAMGSFEGTTIDASDASKDFNGSLEKNWLSADVMSTYLKIMAGEMDSASMAALGLSKTQINAFKLQQANAEEAATKVRTYSQLMGTLQESVGSGWAQSFDLILGDFNEATELFTAVNDELGGIIGGMSDARNNLIAGWARWGGRDNLIEGVANAWKAAKAILDPILTALRDIFPPMTVKRLVEITKGFRDWTASLMPSESVLKNIGRTAKGFFAVLDIGWMIIKGVFGLLVRLVGALAPVGEGFLGASANLGDWLVNLRDAIKSGNLLGKVFEWLGDQGEKVISFFKTLAGNTGEGAMGFGERVAEVWQRVGEAFQAAYQWAKPFFDWLAAAFEQVKGALRAAFEGADFNVLVGLLNVGALGGVVLLVRNFLKKIPDMIKGLFGGAGDGIIEQIKGVFGSLTDTMEAMQAKLKSEALIKIAIAIGILVAAVIALSFIDTGKLFTSLGAMTIMFTQLSAMMLLMEKTMSSKGVAKMPVLAATMILLAGAMVIFASAVAIMASLSWDELARGLLGMAVGMKVMVTAVGALSKLKGQIAKASFSIVILAGAMAALAGALKIFASLSWEELGRSLVAMGGALAIVIATVRTAGSSAQGAAAMLIISGALTVLGAALLVMAKLSWDEILRALGTLAGSLLIMALGVKAIQGSVGGAAAMLIVSGAIVVLAGAFTIFAKLSWDDIGRVLVVLAGGLAILAGAMALMGIPLVLLGSVGILAASVALMALAPALVLLGTMSWDAIGRGLTVLAGALVILAAGGILLIAALPGLLGLGAAIALIGVGALAAGVGIGLFAAGFGLLVSSAASGAETLKTALLTFASIIPEMMKKFAEGLIEFAVTIAKGGTEITAAFTTMLLSILKSIQTTTPEIIKTFETIVIGFLRSARKTTPEVIKTFWVMLNAIISSLEKNVPVLATKGANLIIGFLNAIRKKLPAVARAGTDLMIELINQITKNANRLADKGADAIIKFVNRLSSTIDRRSAEMGRAGGRLAASIIRGMVNGIGNGIGEITSAARNMAANALNAAKNFLNINSPSKRFRDEVGLESAHGVVGGLQDGTKAVGRAGAAMGKAALTGTKKALQDMKSAVAIDPNMAPTIRPVLDLTAIKKDSNLIGGILTPPSLTLDKSVAYASQARMAGEDAQQAESDLEFQRWMESRRGDVIFNQTNNSPKALTNGEIYRRTHNQLSEAKKELTGTDA